MVDEMGGFPKDVNAFIGKNSEFVGKLTFEGTVRIDGKVDGEIFSKGTLIIGPGAQIKAKINVDVVILSGTLNGNIHAKKRIELRAPGKLYGNVATPSLIVEQGVIFEGNCKMENLPNEGEAEKEIRTPASPASAPSHTQGSLRGTDLHKD
jgi:cytoskeletal protein CcmA (bactofilin family)